MSRGVTLLALIGVAVLLLAEGVLRLEPGLPSVRSQVIPFRPHGRPAVLSPMPDIPLRGPRFMAMENKHRFECCSPGIASRLAMV
jgi:hypothetical protein